MGYEGFEESVNAIWKVDSVTVDRECDSPKGGVKYIRRCVHWSGGVMVMGEM